MEAGSGNMEIVDAPGNLILRTHEEEVNVENPGGKVKIDNRNGNIELRFSSPPKDDIDITNASASISISMPEIQISRSWPIATPATSIPNLSPTR